MNGIAYTVNCRLICLEEIILIFRFKTIVPILQGFYRTVLVHLIFTHEDSIICIFVDYPNFLIGEKGKNMENLILLLFLDSLSTVGKKSIRALEIVLAIFLCFECQFLSFYACYKEYKA